MDMPKDRTNAAPRTMHVYSQRPLSYTIQASVTFTIHAPLIFSLICKRWRDTQSWEMNERAELVCKYHKYHNRERLNWNVILYSSQHTARMYECVCTFVCAFVQLSILLCLLCAFAWWPLHCITKFVLVGEFVTIQHGCFINNLATK